MTDLDIDKIRRDASREPAIYAGRSDTVLSLIGRIDNLAAERDAITVERDAAHTILGKKVKEAVHLNWDIARLRQALSEASTSMGRIAAMAESLGDASPGAMLVIDEARAGQTMAIEALDTREAAHD